MNRKKSLSERVLQASFWTFLLHGGARTLALIRNVVLARLLSPQDFGLFGIALVVLSILDRFSNTGLRSAVIQKDEDVREYLDSVWSVHVLRGAALASGLLFGAPYIAEFFEEPDAARLIQMLGLAVLLAGIVNPGVLYYQRELDRKPLFLQHSGAKIADLATSIVLAFVLRSAWALLFGALAARLTQVILSYVLHSYRPRFRIDWRKARELGRYGRWVFLNNALFFLAYRGDNFLVGKILGAPALGIYMMAYSISEVVTVEISRIATEIGFPAYSRVQGEKNRLQKAFSMAIVLVGSIAFPVALTLWLLAEPVTTVILGERWSEVEIVLPFLAIAGAIRALVANGNAAFNAMGHPVLSFKMNLLGVAVTYAFMLPLIGSRGLWGVALAVAAGQIGMLPLFLMYTRRIVGIGPAEVAVREIPALILTGVVGAIVGGICFGLPVSDPWKLTLSIGAGLIGYALAAAIMWKFAAAGPMGVVEQLWFHARGRKSVTGRSASVSAL